MPRAFFAPLQYSERGTYRIFEPPSEDQEQEEVEEECPLCSSSRAAEMPKAEGRWPSSSHSYPPSKSYGELACAHIVDGEKRRTLYRTRTVDLANNLFKALRLDATLRSLIFHLRNFLFSTTHYYHPLHPKAIFQVQAPIPIHPRRLPWRRLAVTILLGFTAFLISTPVLIGALVLVYGGMPPSYADVRLRERMLPQHRWGREGYPLRTQMGAGGFVRGSTYYIHAANGTADEEEGGERYLRFPDHLWGHGLNNVLQEALLYALLAHHANRSYVFEDFVWSHLPLPYTLYDFTLRPTRVPIGAFLGGWIVGQSPGPDPLSVNGNQRRRTKDSLELELHFDGRQRQRGEHSSSLREQREADDPHEEAKQEGRRSGPLIARVLRFSTSWALAQFQAFCFQPSWPRRQKRVYTTTTTTTTTHTDVNVRDSASRVPSGSETTRSVPLSSNLKRSRPSISAEYFEHVCPPSRRVEVTYTWPLNSGFESPNDDDDGSDSVIRDQHEYRDQDHVPEATANGIDILRWWIARLSREDVRDARCVVVREQERRVWDSDFFGTRRPLSLFPVLKVSPVLRAFEWSDLVKRAVDRTVARFFSGTEVTLSEASVARLSRPSGCVDDEDDAGSGQPTGVGPVVNANEDHHQPSTEPDPVAAAHGAITIDNGPSTCATWSPCAFDTDDANLNAAAAERGGSQLVDAGVDVDDDGAGGAEAQTEMEMIPGVLAVHLRRGDYKRHCLRLARWGAGYMGWNRLVEVGAGAVVEGAGGDMGFEDGLRDYMLRGDMGGMRGNVAQDGVTLDPSADSEADVLREVGDEDEEEQERAMQRKEAYYLAHCLPSIPQIVRRLREVRKEYEGLSARKAFEGSMAMVASTERGANADQSHASGKSLREVYVLTNGWPSFVDELREALLNDGWEKVVGSTDVERGDVSDTGLDEVEGNWGLGRGRYGCSWMARDPDMVFIGDGGRGGREACPGDVDVGLSKEEKGVSAAIDMGLAERAEVFVGNGFSSLSANIVMLRLARGFEVHSNRML